MPPKKEKGLPATIKAPKQGDVDILQPPTQKAESEIPQTQKAESSSKQALINKIVEIKSYIHGPKITRHQVIFGAPMLKKIDFTKIDEDELKAIYKYYKDIEELSNKNRDATIEPFDSENMEAMKLIKQMDDKLLYSSKQRKIDQSKVHEGGKPPENILTKFATKRLKDETVLPDKPIYNVQLDDAKKEEAQQTATQTKEESKQTAKQTKDDSEIYFPNFPKNKTPVYPQYQTAKQTGLERLKKYKQIEGMEELDKLHNDMLRRYVKPKLFIEAYEEAKKRIGAIPAKVAAPDLSNKDNGSILQAPSQAINKKVDVKDYANKDYIENQDYNKVSKMTQEEFNKYMEQKAYTEYAEQQNKKVEQQAKSNKPKDESLTSQMGQVEFRQDQGMSVGLNQMFSNQQIDEQKNEQEQKDDMFAPKGSMSAEAVVGTANDLANPVAQAVRQAQLQQFQPQSPNPANVFNVNRRIPVANILKPQPQAQAQAQAPNQVVKQQPIANPARQRPTYKSYSPAELTALFAQKEKEKRNAKVEADAGAEQDKTIGDRAKTGLGTYEMKPAADIVLKSNKDKKKSIHNFANLNWVESRSDSKLGEFSSLKKMIDGEERMRFSNTYRSTNVLPKSQPVMYNKNHAFFKNYLENRMTPMSIANIQQERQPMTQESNQRDGRRPVGARPWTLTDLGDYTYNHNGVVGTQNLGMTPMYQNERKTDYENNTTVFPDTIMNVPDDKLESV